MNNYKFSVVIPTYNAAELLRRTLQSLVTQTYKNFEVIVGDDGSTDHTREVCESFKGDLNIKYIRGENFGGPARPRNNGIKASTSEWVCFLDHDDWWAPEKLERCLVHLDRGADIVFHDLWVVKDADQKSYRKRMYSLQPGNDVYMDLLCRGKSILTSTVVVKTEIMRRIGGFSEDRILITVEDWDAWLRIAQITDKFVRINECLGYYWAGGGNMSVSKRPETIDSVYSRHLINLNPDDRSRVLAMRAYDLGRSYQLRGDWANAVPLLKQSLFGRSLLSFRLKSLFLLVNILLRKLLGKSNG